jgi:hypothetical protein
MTQLLFCTCSAVEEAISNYFLEAYDDVVLHRGPIDEAISTLVRMVDCGDKLRHIFYVDEVDEYWIPVGLMIGSNIPPIGSQIFTDLFPVISITGTPQFWQIDNDEFSCYVTVDCEVDFSTQF